jgi:hypothetical protein
MKYVPVILSGVAALFAVAAFGIVLFNAGPPGPRGAQGAQGPQGAQGTQGIAGKSASTAATTAAVKQLAQVKACLPELTTWINGFYVSSDTMTRGGDTWLTNSYLDTSANQVSAACQPILFAHNGAGE